VEKHDIAITSVSASPLIAYVGTPVEITVEIVNLGNFTETFNVTVYYDTFKIATREVWSLDSGFNLTMSIIWDTANVSPGNYTIWALAEFVPEEVNVTNNVFTDGKVTLLPKPPPPIIDIGIVDVSISKGSLYIGESLRINVSVINKGTETETFDVGTYYDFLLIGILRVYALSPNTQVTLNFVWNTSSVHEGFYQISASAPLPDDVNVSDNTFVDGVVQVKAKPPPPPSTYLLNITSSPISDVNFTINSIPTRTPYSATHREGFYTIAFPPEWTDPNTGRRYIFSRWNDFSTNPTRTINLVSDMRLTAHYEEAEFTLTINTTTGGTTNPSPEIYRYPEGTLVIVTAISNTGYEFDHWTLGGGIRTENPITIVMDKNYTLTAYFKAVSTHALSITSDPIIGVDFTINGVKQTTPYSATLEEKSYTVVMPASVTDSKTGKVYNFRGWEDGSANLTRIILLTEIRT
jgi:hypothetical protein